MFAPTQAASPLPTPPPTLLADLIGFHTFDYARHFLSCCSRMLGLEHKTNRGSIIIEYYGRDVGIKIMPTGAVTRPGPRAGRARWPHTHTLVFAGAAVAAARRLASHCCCAPRDALPPGLELAPILTSQGRLRHPFSAQASTRSGC